MAPVGNGTPGRNGGRKPGGRGRYAKRGEYRLGEWYLTTRGDSPALYRARTHPETGRPERASLGTTDWDEAKQRLTAWYIANVRPENAPAAEMLMADVLMAYWNAHAQHLPSKGSAKVYYNAWLDFFGTDTVEVATKPQRQAAFRAALLARMKPSSAGRAITFGKAALSRSYKLGEMAALPFVQGIADGENQPKKGRRLTLAELRALFDAARDMEPHVTRYLCLLLGTSARSGALFDLRWNQVDLATGIIDLNPPGRVGTKKRRGKVKACAYLLERLRYWHKQDGGTGHLIQWRGDRVNTMRTVWRTLRDVAGVPSDERGPVVPYSFRHTTAWWCRAHGASQWEVDGLLAHSKGMTDIYADADPHFMEASRKAIQKLFLEVVRQPRKVVDATGIEPVTSPV